MKKIGIIVFAAALVSLDVRAASRHTVETGARRSGYSRRDDGVTFQQLPSLLPSSTYAR